MGIIFLCRAREQLFGGHHPQEQQQSGYGEQSSGGFHNAQAILKDQDKIMDEQDEQLAHLQKSVRTLLNVSREINEELEHQEGIIDELGNEIGKTNDKITKTEKRTEDIVKKNKGCTVM
eukprot:TRINITY_DN1149_c0_g1_i2.p3 TRINITY_DN1149_c0_g1~~TRINITY_DN1149_c0_g1_i2.p3  ORF type:complete len:119 (+),score=23.76 TRINITY_DN1149_c0_g1_i2:533-889(+)